MGLGTRLSDRVGQLCAESNFSLIAKTKHPRLGGSRGPMSSHFYHVLSMFFIVFPRFQAFSGGFWVTFGVDPGVFERERRGRLPEQPRGPLAAHVHEREDHGQPGVEPLGMAADRAKS